MHLNNYVYTPDFYFVILNQFVANMNSLMAVLPNDTDE
jgi:hypothetical protein